MSIKAGQLLWNRQRINLYGDGLATSINTGLTQLNKSFANDSSDEPPLGIAALAPPPDGATPASRVHVIPMAPIAKWNGVTHSEPYFNTTTGTVWINFYCPIEGGVQDLNVLFWDPHSSVGPGQAETYNTEIPPGPQ